MVALVAACQAQLIPGTDAASAASPPARRGEDAGALLLQRIDAEIGNAACSSDSDCRTLPIGSKACGGPARWVAWSAQVSDAQRLQTLALALAQQQRQRDMADGRMSTCSVVPDPGASCAAGSCTLATRNPRR